MKKVYVYLLTAGFMLSSLQLFAQKKRYIDEVFVDSDIEVTSDVTYATNIDFLRSSRLPTASPTKIGTELTTIKTALAMGQQIPSTHFDLADTNSVIKCQKIMMDVYAPKASADTTTKRPVILYLHTGNFLPAGINGSPLGTKVDSSAIVLCRGWAKRGYVAISVDYRLGWNPLASGPTGEYERRGTLLNAVYRAIQDVKQCVQGLRVDASGSNTFGIDPDKIVLYGEGTGAYLSLAYATLDKYPEMSLTKFLNPVTSKSFIDTAIVGRIDGSGIPQSLTLYPPPRTSMDVSAVVAAGGALADTSWLEKGDPMMVALQCVRDPFAPFGEGTVVVPTTQENVVDVQGANIYMQKAVALGNNDAIKSMPNDAYTKAARARYGMTYDYIYPAPLDKITVNAGLEGLFPVVLPKATGSNPFENQAGPWQWWDPNSPLAKWDLGGGITAHMAGLQSNKDMSPQKGRTWVDTIQGYVCPRLAVGLGFYTTTELSAPGFEKIQAKAYPNPTSDVLYIRLEDLAQIKTVQVTNIMGEVVMAAQDVNRSFTEVNLSSLTDGCYFVEISTDKGSAVQKVMVRR